MYKWMFDRLVEEYKKEPIEDLVGKLIAMQNIECKDRSFANQCEAGTTIYSLNEFFGKVEKLCNTESPTERDTLINEIKVSFPESKGSYSYIRNRIRGINDDNRCDKETRRVLDDMRKAKDDNDVV